jgi:hypothetical protein
MNVVCLIGQLAEPPEPESSLWPGWDSLVLRVPREGVHGEEDAGVFSVRLALPPGFRGIDLHDREAGPFVAVVGVLAVETDYSGGVPLVRHAVIPRLIERVRGGSRPRF